MMTTGPLLYPKLPYDVARIEPVITVCKIEHGVVVGSAVPAKTLAEFVAWMKASPGKAFYGIPAAGSSPHFVGMLLARAAGVEAQAVLYRGGPPMVADLLGGQVPAAVNVLGNFIEQHRAGKLRVLATSGAARSPLLQDVPTLAESGYPQAQVEDWYGFMAKVGTPKSESTAFAAAVREVMEMRDVRAALQTSGHNPYVIGADELAKDIVNSQKQWAEVIKQTGFKLES
jgi:tripartite-type tricarboxylate transporter receptor subunit TctC